MNTENTQERTDTEDTKESTGGTTTNIDTVIEPIFAKIAEIIKENKIKEAAFIFTLEGYDEPFIYYSHGHFYDAAKLLAYCTRKFKGLVARDLEG